MLFNNVEDMLAVLIKRPKASGQIARVDDDLSIMQCADDTILIMKHDIEKRFDIYLLNLCVPHWRECSISVAPHKKKRSDVAFQAFRMESVKELPSLLKIQMMYSES